MTPRPHSSAVEALSLEQAARARGFSRRPGRLRVGPHPDRRGVPGDPASPLLGEDAGRLSGGDGDGADPMGASALAPLVTVSAVTFARSRKVARNVLR